MSSLRDYLLEVLTGLTECLILSVVSLPKLIDFDWRVDVKTSSNAISRMSMPTCIMQLQVSENCKNQNRLKDAAS